MISTLLDSLLKKGDCSLSPAMKDFSDWLGQQELIDLPKGGAVNTDIHGQINRRIW